MSGLITPSSLWQGTPATGSRWTVEQLAVLRRERRDPTRVPVDTIGRRAKRHPENWELPPPIERVELPRLATNLKNGHVLVVTPAGAKKWMEALNG